MRVKLAIFEEGRRTGGKLSHDSTAVKLMRFCFLLRKMVWMELFAACVTYANHSRQCQIRLWKAGCLYTAPM